MKRKIVERLFLSEVIVNLPRVQEAVGRPPGCRPIVVALEVFGKFR